MINRAPLVAAVAGAAGYRVVIAKKREHALAGEEFGTGQSGKLAAADLAEEIHRLLLAERPVPACRRPYPPAEPAAIGCICRGLSLRPQTDCPPGQVEDLIGALR